MNSQSGEEQHMFPNSRVLGALICSTMFRLTVNTREKSAGGSTNEIPNTNHPTLQPELHIPGHFLCECHNQGRHHPEM
eukprot:Ihof_evm3s795 gene=Ihof_evmTU3s795